MGAIMNRSIRWFIASTATLIRLPIIVLFIISLSGPFLVSLAWIVIWLLSDQMDGMIARRLGIDNVTRRIMDVVVDHVSVTCSFVAAFYYHSEYLTLLVLSAWSILACFKLGYSVIGIVSYAKYRVLLRSTGPSNKVFNLGQAITGLAMVYGISAPTLAVIVSVLCVLKLRPTLITISAFRESVCRTHIRGAIIENHIPLFGAHTRRILKA